MTSEYKYFPERGFGPHNCLYRDSAQAARARRVLAREIESEYDEMTIEELLSSLESEKKNAERNIADIDAEMREINSIKGRLTAEQESHLRELRHNRPEAMRAVSAIDAKIERAKEVKAEEDEADRLSRPVESTRIQPPRMTVTRNESAFRPDDDPTGVEFIREVGKAHMGNSRSQERLARHDAEMRANTGISDDFGGHVIPQYAMDLAAPAINARSNFRDLAHSIHPLPAEGMDIKIPYGSATSAAEQSAELTPVETTQMSTSLLSVPVRTFDAGQVLSRQAIERGTGLEQFVITDLLAQLAAAIDSALLNTAVSGALAVAVDTPFTGASAEDLYQAICDAEAAVEVALDGVPADYAVMDSLTWNYLAKALTDVHPLIGNGSINAGQLGSPEYQRVRGILPNGLAVIVDNHLPVTAETNLHTVLVGPRQESHLWQNGAVLIRAEQPLVASLGVQLVAYEYIAATYERYDNALASVSAVDVAPAA